jgi:hypothetical protein
MTGFPINSMSVGENVAPLLSGVCVLANSKHHTLQMSPHWRLESCLAKNRRFLRSHQSRLDLIPLSFAQQCLDQA